MEFEKIPCVYYPTKVVMVDDNQFFLENARITIKDYLNVVMFSNPEIALSYLLAYSSPLENLDITKNIDDDEIDIDNTLSIDYKKLATLLTNKNDISVLIIDYSMPEINGLDFCDKIQSLNFNKIMLTGEADTQIAVDAFNRGIIDKFLIKEGSNIYETLNQYVDKLKEKYFLDSKINNLVSSFNKLKDSPDYIRIVNSWMKTNLIIKFYQIDMFGSLIGYDASDNTYHLHLVNDEFINRHIEIANQQGGDSDLLNQLSSKNKIPVFLTEESKNLTVDQWSDIFYTPDGFFEFNTYNFYYCSVSL